MNSLVAALLSGLSSAALSVFARLISKKMFEELLERLIIAGVDMLADKTESKMLDDVAAIVKKQLEDKGNEPTA